MKKYLIYCRKHFDFIILDMITMILAYWFVVEIRYAVNPVYHGELFTWYGFVLCAVYLVILIVTQNLDNILKRSIFREMAEIAKQMFLSWAFFTVAIYAVKIAQNFSRSVYAAAFVVCSFAVLVERVVWKWIVRFSNLHKFLAPKLIVVCDSDKSHQAIKRSLHGAFESEYDIVGVVLSDKGESDYRDHFDYILGLDNIKAFVEEHKANEAFVELSDAGEEEKIIKVLLDENIIVHRSLGDSKMDYMEQEIEFMSDHSVITIKDTELSIVAKAENLRSKRRKKKKENDQ